MNDDADGVLKLIKRLLRDSPGYEDGTYDLVTSDRQYTVLVNSSEEWAERIVLRGDGYIGLRIANTPERSSMVVAVYRRVYRRAPVHQWITMEDFEIDGRVVWLPGVQEHNDVVIAYNEESWEGRARRTWDGPA